MIGFVLIDILLIILCVFLILIIIKILIVKKKYQHIPGPKSRGYIFIKIIKKIQYFLSLIEFFFGQYFTIHKFLSENNFIEDLQLQWSKKFGPVYVYQFFHQMICVTSDEDAIKVFLSSFLFNY